MPETQENLETGSVQSLDQTTRPSKPWQQPGQNERGVSASRPWAGRATGVRDREKQIRRSLRQQRAAPRQLEQLSVMPREQPSTSAVWMVRLLILCGTIVGVRYAAPR